MEKTLVLQEQYWLLEAALASISCIFPKKSSKATTA